jgi:hypothetical protein
MVGPKVRNSKQGGSYDPPCFWVYLGIFGVSPDRRGLKTASVWFSHLPVYEGLTLFHPEWYTAATPARFSRENFCPGIGAIPLKTGEFLTRRTPPRVPDPKGSGLGGG